MKAVKNRMKQSDKYKLNWEDYHGYDLIVEFLQAEAKLQVPSIDLLTINPLNTLKFYFA